MNSPQDILVRAGSALRSHFDPRQFLRHPSLSQAPGKLERFLQLREFGKLQNIALRDASSPNSFDSVLKQLHLVWDCPETEWRRIPASGPVIVVANHPYGLADGLILGSMVSKVRADVRVLANALLGEGPIIPVDPFEDRGSVKANVKSLRRAVEWLKSGGALIVFPAGEVAALNLSARSICESPWKPTVVRLIQLSGATVVPTFFHGTNSPTFHLAGLVHPGLRTALLPRELMNKQGRTIRLRVGKPIPAPALLEGTVDGQALEYLRWRACLLGSRPSRGPGRVEKSLPPAIAPPGDARTLRNEVEALDPSQTLLEASGYRVCLAPSAQIPAILREIGRLREISFRQAGEGTGRPLDLDQFDQHYLHLFAWNHERREIAGAYRLADTDQVLSQEGPGGLYTTTLFNLKPEIFRAIGPALELGRSFVRPEYQKNFLPLLLLWKGIGAYVARQPQYRYLFGPVSISNSYSSESRSLMAGYLQRYHLDRNLAARVMVRSKVNTQCCPAATIDQLSDAVQDLEPDGKGVPVLLRQYLNLNGKVLGFEVDRAFSQVLDALLVVDLTQAPVRLLERYLGKSGAEGFLRYQLSKTAVIEFAH